MRKQCGGSVKVIASIEKTAGKPIFITYHAKQTTKTNVISGNPTNKSYRTVALKHSI